MSKPYRDSDNADLWRQYADELEVENAVLRQKNAKLLESVVTWPERFARAWKSLWSEDTLTSFFGLVIVVLVGGLTFYGGYAIYKASMATGRVEHCYVDHADGRVALHGYVSWDTDKSYGSFATTEDAIKMAERLGCSIK